MLAFPGTKINLGLSVKRKRTDGFHEVETVFYPLQYSDILEVVPSDSFGFQSSGIEVPGEQNNNLVVKAYDLMRSKYKTSIVKMHLHKLVPPGTGLGGGSADAAAMLTLLDEISGLNLDFEALETIASELGSDCPFFIHRKPSLAKGRGDVLYPLSLSLQGYFIVLVLPQISISTVEAYKQIKPKAPFYPPSEIIQEPVESWKGKLVNDFEELPVVPDEIRQIKAHLYAKGALYASLSGSGSAVFGIFNKKQNVEDLRKKYPVHVQMLK